MAAPVSLAFRVAANLDQFKANMAEMKAQLETTKQAMQKMANTFNGSKVIADGNAMVKVIADIGGASKLTEAEQARVNRTMNEAIARYQRFGQTAPKAMIDLEAATRKVEDQTKVLADRLSAFGSKATSVGTAMSAAITLPLVGAAAASLNLSGKFEEITTRMVSLGGVSQDQLGAVRQHILDLAPAVGIGPIPLADAMMKISSTVSDANVAMQILDMAAKGSAAGMGEPIEVAGALTAVINSYGAANISAAEAANILTRAVQDGGAEAAELAPTLANVVPMAAQLGISFQEVAANIATLTKLGVPAAEAVTSLSSVMTGLLKESNEGQTALASIGSSYAQLRQEIKEKGLAAAMADLNTKVGENKTLMTDIFGRVEAVRNIMGTAGQQAATYADEIDRMNKAAKEGTALDDAFNKMKGTQVQTMRELRAQIESVAIAFGNELAPHLKQILEAAKPVLHGIESIVKAFAAMPDSVQTAALVVVTAFAASGPALLALGGMAKSVSNLIQLYRDLTIAETAAGVAGAGGSAAGGVGILAKVGGALASPVALTAAGATAGLAYITGMTGAILGDKGLKGLKTSVADVLTGGVTPKITSDIVFNLDAIATAAATKATPAMELAALKAELAKTSLSALSKEAREGALAIFAHGGSVTDAVKSLEAHKLADKGAEDALNLLHKQFEDGRQKAEAHAKAVRAVNESMVSLTGEQVRAIELALSMSTVNGKLLASEAEIAEAYGFTEAAVKSVMAAQATQHDLEADRLKLEVAAHKQAAETYKTYVDQQIKLGQQLAAAVVKNLQVEKAAREDAAKQTQTLALLTVDAQIAAAQRGRAAVETILQLQIEKEQIAYRAQIATIQRNADAQVEQLTKFGLSYDAAMAQVKVSTDLAMKAAAIAFGLRINEMEAAVVTFKDKLSAVFESIPNTIARAFEGGGDIEGALKSIASQIGAVIGEGIGAAIGGKIGGKIGGAIGSLAGTGLGALVGFFRDHQSDDEKRMSQQLQADAKAASDRAKQAYDETIAYQQGMTESLDKYREAWQFLSADGVARVLSKQLGDLAKAHLDLQHAGLSDAQATRALSGEYNGLIGQLTKAGVSLDRMPPQLISITRELAKMGQLSEENTRALLGMSETALPNWKAMEEAANKYGLELSALGPKFEEAKLGDLLAGYASDFQLLIDGGADMTKVIEAMGPKTQESIQKAIDLGKEIPASMKPLVQGLIDAGVLVDANGDKLTDLTKIKFGATMAEETDKLLKKLDDVDHVFRDTLPDAAREAARQISAAFATITFPSVPGQDTYVPDVPVYPQANGGDYLVHGPTLFLAGEAGPERATFSRVGGGGGMVSVHTPIVIHSKLVVDGRQLGRASAKYTIKDLLEAGA